MKSVSQGRQRQWLVVAITLNQYAFMSVHGKTGVCEYFNKHVTVNASINRTGRSFLTLKQVVHSIPRGGGEVKFPCSCQCAQQGFDSPSRKGHRQRRGTRRRLWLSTESVRFHTFTIDVAHTDKPSRDRTQATRPSRRRERRAQAQEQE
jgi:hypothetical protein